MKNYEGISKLSERFAKANGTSVKEAREIILRVADTMKQSLLDENNDGVKFINFITIEKVTRKARLGRNPKTKEEVQIPERKSLKVTIGEKYFKRLNS